MNRLRILRAGTALGSLLLLGSVLAQAISAGDGGTMWPEMTMGAVLAAIWHHLHIECSMTGDQE
ncbi:MAG: hypothetical protein Q7V53_02855 [Caldisericota bacterium]|nr:hypothetical protein [Caldisericota bacterium]